MSSALVEHTGTPVRYSDLDQLPIACVADASGLVVSSIESIYHDFGSAVVAGDTGIIMQNRGSFFSLDDNHPNRLEPGKRTFHTIIPAMMLKDGEPVLAYGTMGAKVNRKRRPPC